MSVPQRAGDADREAVLELLRHATVDGRLTVDELAERAGLTHEARTHDELAAVTADLDGAANARQPAGVPDVPAAEHRTVLSRARHTGRRALRPGSRFSCLLGSVLIDLRDVVLETAELDLELHAVLGAIQVLVPEGIELQLLGDGPLLNREVHLRHVPVPPGAPVVRLHVSGTGGSVTVRSRPRRQVRRSH